MMSLEVLKVIILACQVSMGGERPIRSWSFEVVDQYQAKCQKIMIQCYEKSKQTQPYAVRDCLMRR